MGYIDVDVFLEIIELSLFKCFHLSSPCIIDEYSHVKISHTVSKLDVLVNIRGVQIKTSGLELPPLILLLHFLLGSFQLLRRPSHNDNIEALFSEHLRKSFTNSISAASNHCPGVLSISFSEIPPWTQKVRIDAS